MQTCCCPGRRDDVPVVVLVVEGGYTTLLTAFKAIETKTPVLVLAGSGRAADFIASAYENYEKQSVQTVNGVLLPSIVCYPTS